MIDADNFRELAPAPPQIMLTSSSIYSGIPIPKTKLIELFSPDDWEGFTEEWASSLASYSKVVRFAGAGDKGLDIVGFLKGSVFTGGWDNYQCKHYDNPLTPSDIWVEIGKIIYYSFLGDYPPPKVYYFVCPNGIGTKLAKFLAAPDKLKSETKKNWVDHCQTGITSTAIITLTGDLLDYFEQFDFSVFSSKSAVELINEHALTPFHAARFGGGLPGRPSSVLPPTDIAPSESRYIQQLFQAYSEYTGEPINDEIALNSKPNLKKDFARQRERFYSAESLRNFARDTVPQGTFEEFQEEVFQGVVDIYESSHDDGLARMRATLSQSAQLPLTSSPLSSVMKVQDKQGVCHQFANIDRLIWVQDEDE